MCPSKEKQLSGSGTPVSNNLQSHLLTREPPEREKISKMSTVPYNHKLSLITGARREAESVLTFYMAKVQRDAILVRCHSRLLFL